MHKPSYVDATKWTGDNLDEIKEFLGTAYCHVITVNYKPVVVFKGYSEMRALLRRGNYIVKPESGGFYAVRPEEFWANYEEVKE